jgi:hypothetical protein
MGLAQDPSVRASPDGVPSPQGEGFSHAAYCLRIRASSSWTFATVSLPMVSAWRS